MKSEEVLINTYNFPMKSWEIVKRCEFFLSPPEVRVKEEKVPDNEMRKRKERRKDKTGN